MSNATPQLWGFGGASQGQTFLRCESRWWFEYVCGLAEDPSPAMLHGTAVHAVVEHVLVYNNWPRTVDVEGVDTEVTEPMIQAARRLLAHCPAPPVSRHNVERRFVDNELAAPVQVRGTVDLVDPTFATLADGRQALRVVDHKTTSHLKWAPLGTEVKSRFQAAVYTAHIARVMRWTGPVLFVFNYVERSSPYRSELRQATFEPHEVVEAREWVVDVMHRMAAAAKATCASQIGHNLDACREYPPNGCPHKTRCAELGRATMGEMSFLFTDLSGDVTMSDPLSMLLAQQSQPAPTPAPTSSPNAAREAIKQQVWAIDPMVQIPDGADVKALHKAAAEKQTRLIVEIKTLGSAATDAELRALTTVQLDEVRAQLARPTPVENMSRDALAAELVERMPQAAPFVGNYGEEQLRAALTKVRADQQGADHAINAPENIPDTTPPTIPAETKQTAPVLANTSARGVKLPLPDGPKLLSKCTVDDLRGFIVSKGCNYPAGKGSKKRAQAMAKVLVTGSTDVEKFGPFEGASVAPQSAPASAPTLPPHPVGNEAQRAQLDACVAEIQSLGDELGIEVTVNTSDVAEVVQTLQRLRAERDKRAAEALELPAPPSKVASPEPTRPPTPDEVVADGFELLVDCRPVGPALSLDLDKLVDACAAAVAKSKGVPHWLAIGYNEGAKLVGAMVHTQLSTNRARLLGTVYVSTRTILGPVLVDALSPLAARVIKGDS